MVLQPSTSTPEYLKERIYAVENCTRRTCGPDRAVYEVKHEGNCLAPKGFAADTA